MPLERFIPKSPDPFIRNSQDFEVAKFGHLNTIIEYVNTYVVTDSLQLAGTGPLSTTLRAITDNIGNTSKLLLSTTSTAVSNDFRFLGAISGYVAIEAPNSVTTYTLKLPSTTGSAGQAIITDGSGNLSFGTVTTSPSGVAGAIQFSNGSAFASDATNLFWNNTTKRLGIGTNAPTQSIETPNAIVFASANNDSKTTLKAFDAATGNIDFTNEFIISRQGTNLVKMFFNNTIGIGGIGSAAKLGVRGSGSTSATTSLLVQNSSSIQGLAVTDDGTVYAGWDSTGGVNSYFSANGDVGLGRYGSGLTYIKSTGSVKLQSNNFEFSNGSLYMANSSLLSTGSAGFGVSPSLARLQVKGSGSTSATTSLLVQNSNGVASLQILDNGSVFNNGAGSIGTNTAYGFNALVANTTGNSNVAIGTAALVANTTGVNNVAVGQNCLITNSSGSNNVGVGRACLQSNSGVSNTAVGSGAMQNNTSGISNVAIGQGAASANTTGGSNTVVGATTSTGNFSGSTILGLGATATANNQFVVGSAGTNAGVIDTAAVTPTQRWKVKINGVDYYIALEPA